MPRVADSSTRRAIRFPRSGSARSAWAILPAASRLHRSVTEPICLFIALPAEPIDLYVDGFDDVVAVDIRAIFLDRIVSANHFTMPEDARHLRPRQPGQILEAPDVMMRVYGGDGFQGVSLPQVRRAGPLSLFFLADRKAGHRLDDSRDRRGVLIAEA